MWIVSCVWGSRLRDLQLVASLYGSIYMDKEFYKEVLERILSSWKLGVNALITNAYIMHQIL